MYAVNGFINDNTVITDENILRFEGRRVIITILDSKIDEVYEAEQLEAEKKIRRNAALGLAGLWKSHDNTVSVDKIVRGLRRRRQFDN